MVGQRGLGSWQQFGFAPPVARVHHTCAQSGDDQDDPRDQRRDADLGAGGTAGNAAGRFNGRIGQTRGELFEHARWGWVQRAQDLAQALGGEQRRSSSDTSLRERGAQALQGLVELKGDSASGHGERIGDLVLREAGAVVERDDLAAAVG